MRKLFALLFVAGTLSFASCGDKKGTEEASTTEAVDTTAAPVEEQVTPVDTTNSAAPAVEDTTAH